MAEEWYVGTGETGDFNFFLDNGKLVDARPAITSASTGLIRVATTEHAMTYWTSPSAKGRFSAIPKAFKDLDTMYGLYQEMLVEAMASGNAAVQAKAPFWVTQNYTVLDRKTGLPVNLPSPLTPTGLGKVPPLTPHVVGLAMIVHFKDLHDPDMQRRLACDPTYGVPTEEHNKYQARVTQSQVLYAGKDVSRYLCQIVNVMDFWNNCPTPSQFDNDIKRTTAAQFRSKHFVAGTDPFTSKEAWASAVARPNIVHRYGAGDGKVPLKQKPLTEQWAQERATQHWLSEGRKKLKPVETVELVPGLRATFVGGELVCFNLPQVELPPKQVRL